MLCQESDRRIAEHYTDTAGFTDHLFAPRIRDLSDTKLYAPPGSPAHGALQPLLGGPLNVRHILAHWEPSYAWLPPSSRARPYLSSLGWEYLNLMGDYSWRTKLAPGKFQLLRPVCGP